MALKSCLQLMQRSQFWAQLDLQASLTLPESNGTVSGTPQSFSLRLLHFAGEVASKTEEAPTSSARPPNGVPRATLDEIQITFSLAKTVAESSRKRLKPPLQDSDTLLHTDEDCILEEASFSQPDLRLPSIEWEEETHKLKSSSQSSATDIADMLDEDGALSLQSREHECYVASRVDGNSQSTPQQNHLGKGKRNMSDNTLSSSHISTSHRLIHTAINKMICGKRIRTPPGIKAVAVTPGPKLADVAPAIFSPGYRKVKGLAAFSILRLISETRLCLRGVVLYLPSPTLWSRYVVMLEPICFGQQLWITLKLLYFLVSTIGTVP